MKINSILLSIIILLASCAEKPKAKSSVLFPYYEKAGPSESKSGFKIGYVDSSGNRVIDNNYTHAHPFSEGFGCVGVSIENNVRYGYIDSASNWVIEPRFRGARPFREGRALVLNNKEGKWGFINKYGEFISPQIFSEVTTNYYKGISIAYVQTGWKTPGRFGSTVLQVITLGLLKDNRKTPVYNCYQIDLNGDTTIIAEGVLNTDYSNYIQARRQNNLGLYWTNSSPMKYGYKKIDTYEFEPAKRNYSDRGTEFIAPIYVKAENFRYGYAHVQFENGEQGFIDTNGVVVVRFMDARSQ